jgi:CHC2 zinc finger/Bifunctional DNA primase/polymerase, N-terminal
MSIDIQTLEAARYWLSLGAKLLPVQPGSKRLVATFGLEKTIDSDAQAVQWFGARRCGIAVIVPAGLYCLDFDNADLYTRWRRGPGGAALTRIEKSRRGWHVFGRGEVAADQVPVLGLDLRRPGHVIFCAPSARYTLLTDFEISPLRLDGLFQTLPTKQPPDKAPRQFSDRASLVAAIKNEFDILSLANEFVALSQRNGRFWVANCPFHPDKEKRFWVDSARGLCGCHSTKCRFHGCHDVINLYAELHGLGVREAIEALRLELPEPAAAA